MILSPTAGPHVLMAADVPASRDTGLGRHQWFLARELERRGFSVKEFYAEMVCAGRQSAWRRFAFPFAVLREAWLGPGRERGYDFAVVHEGSAALICLARRLGLLRARCVVVSHNPEQKVWEFTLARVAQGLVSVKRNSRWIWPLTRLAQSNCALKYGDQILCLSEEDVQFICRRYGRSPETVERISNGVEEGLFECLPSAGPPRILFLGSWLPHKGIRELRAALCSLLPRHPAVQASLAGVGAPAEAVRREFPPALRARIRIESHLDPEQLPSILAQHNIFVLPSWYEGMPLSLLEAMAAGLAPVVTSVGGMRDVVRDQVDGLAVPCEENGAALTAALDSLCLDASLRDRLGAAARRRAREFTWSRAGERLTEILYGQWRGRARCPVGASALPAATVAPIDSRSETKA